MSTLVLEVELADDVANGGADMKRFMFVLALTCATPLEARDLGVPTGKGWKHAETGLILMPQLAGLLRSSLTDATQTEHDVAAQFDAPDKSVFATVYIFHPAIAEVGLWFDRSQTELETRDIFRNAAPASADPISFSAAGSRSQSSLRQVYGVPGGRYRSTALAVVPVGEWMVSIRISATSLTADQLDARLRQLIDDIRWPTAVGPTNPPAPVKACTKPLAYTKAKQVKANGADMLMSLLGPSIAAKQKAKGEAAPEPRPTWCRDGEARTEYGVYRNDRAAGYVLALYDAGRVVSVFPSLMGQVDGSGTYAVSLEDVDGTVSTYPSFASLPSPKQAWDLVESGTRTGTAKGNQVTIQSKGL